MQCLHLGPLWNFARVCFYVLRALPRKHRVCAVLFPRPLLSLYACVCHVLLCVLCLTNIGSGFCSAFLSVRFKNVCALNFVMLCYGTSPHKHQFCAVLLSRLPFKLTRLRWSCFVVRVFRFTWLPIGCCLSALGNDSLLSRA